MERLIHAAIWAACALMTVTGTEIVRVARAEECVAKEPAGGRGACVGRCRPCPRHNCCPSECGCKVPCPPPDYPDNPRGGPPERDYPRGGPPEEDYPRGGGPPGGYFAPPPTGVIEGPSRGVELGGVSITFPELTIGLPKLRIKGFTRLRQESRMHMEGGVAPYVSSPMPGAVMGMGMAPGVMGHGMMGAGGADSGRGYRYPDESRGREEPRSDKRDDESRGRPQDDVEPKDDDKPRTAPRSDDDEPPSPIQKSPHQAPRKSPVQKADARELQQRLDALKRDIARQSKQLESNLYELGKLEAEASQYTGESAEEPAEEPTPVRALAPIPTPVPDDSNSARRIHAAEETEEVNGAAYLRQSSYVEPVANFPHPSRPRFERLPPVDRPTFSRR